MEKLLARIGYVKDDDAYTLFLSSDGGKTWGECLTCFCEYRKDDTQNEPCYIHISLIEKLKECIRFGYKIVY